MKTIILLTSIFLFINCADPIKKSENISLNDDSVTSLENLDSITIEEEFNFVTDRAEIIERLSSKIENNEPLIVHIFVPLCDNENQGIVPTSESLGNGLDLKRNLYWATSKGVKKFYKELPDWKEVENEFNIDSNILERIVFKKNFKNSAIVYLIADAYRGDRMNECLAAFFNSLSGNRIDSMSIEDKEYEVASNADLFIFNGHNGLMDDDPTILPPKRHKPKDAVSISCVSGKYFKGYYQEVNAFPLVNTNHLLYPGAFISEEIINKWANLGSAENCKVAAGKSYYKHKPKSGPNGSQNLFNFGYNF